MKRIASYHVHTTWCDGHDSPEAMVRAAIEQKMTDIGFSAHAMWPFASEWHLSPASYGDYAAEIRSLKEKYVAEIRISRGFEADYLEGASAPDRATYSPFSPDYLIGSVHYVPAPSVFGKKSKKVEPWCVDAPAAEVARGLERAFGGDAKKAVSAYWGRVREMIGGADFDIIGHIDIPRKRNGELRFFSETESWYRREIKNTVKAAARSGKIMEINTGAIARGIRDMIYPSLEFLNLAFEAGVPITINSDSHATDSLLCAYDQARRLALDAGYRSASFLDDGGWTSTPLDSALAD